MRTFKERRFRQKWLKDANSRGFLWVYINMCVFFFFLGGGVDLGGPLFKSIKHRWVAHPGNKGYIQTHSSRRLAPTPIAPFATRQRSVTPSWRSVSAKMQRSNAWRPCLGCAYCGWTKSCTTFKPWEAIVCWHLQAHHHSKVS